MCPSMDNLFLLMDNLFEHNSATFASTPVLSVSQTLGTFCHTHTHGRSVIHTHMRAVQNSCTAAVASPRQITVTARSSFKTPVILHDDSKAGAVMLCTSLWSRALANLQLSSARAFTCLHTSCTDYRVEDRPASDSWLLIAAVRVRHTCASVCAFPAPRICDRPSH